MRTLWYVLFCAHIFFIFTHNAWAKKPDVPIPPVVLKADKNKSITSGPKMRITHQQITDQGMLTLAQALRTLGALQLVDTSGNGSQAMISMRGFGGNASSNSLLLIDGVPIVNPDLAPPDLNLVPLYQVESIEIIPGSESVLYGDQAVGGVVNVITHQDEKRKSKSKIPALDFSCTVGSYNERRCYVSIGHHYRQLQYHVNLLTNYTNGYRQHNNYHQNQLSGDLKYPYSTGSFRFDYRFGNQRVLYPGALTAEQVAQNRRQANNTSDFFKDWNGFYHLQQQQDFGANWHLKTDIARRQMNGSGILFSPFTQSRIVNTIAPRLTGKIKNTLLTTGMDLEGDYYQLGSAYGVTQDMEQKYSLYAIDDMPIFSAWSLSIGARGALMNNQLQPDNNTANRALVSTLGVTYQFNPQSQFYIRRAGNYRFPKADENASSISGDGLKTQTGVSYETGIEWKLQKANTKINIYQLNLKNEIAYDPTQTAQDPFGTNRNLDPTSRRGFSITEKYQILEQVLIDGQYQFVNARFQQGMYAGKRIPLVAANIFHAGVDYAITPLWNLYAETLFTGNEFADNDDANITTRIGGYAVYNFNLRFHYRHFIAALHVNNIFNKYYNAYTVFTPSIDVESFYPAPGRSLFLTMEYVFA